MTFVRSFGERNNISIYTCRMRIQSAGQKRAERKRGREGHLLPVDTISLHSPSSPLLLDGVPTDASTTVAVLENGKGCWTTGISTSVQEVGGGGGRRELFSLMMIVVGIVGNCRYIRSGGGPMGQHFVVVSFFGLLLCVL